MSQHTDVLVIGGGIAGLTAAAYCAKAGRKVVLVEKQQKTGGCFGTFTENGCSFDHGIRAIENSGVLMPMLHDLGIASHVEFVENPVAQSIRGTLFPLRSHDDMDRFLSGLAVWFPEEEAGLRSLAELVRKHTERMDSMYGRTNPLFLPPWRVLFSYISWTLKHYSLLKELSDLSHPMRRSAETVIAEHVKDPRLVSVLTRPFFAGTPAHFMLSYHRLFFEYLYPKGGMGSVTQALEGYITAKGQRVLVGEEITEIIPGDEVEARLASGTAVSAGHCIIACDPGRFAHITGVSLGALPGESVFSLFLTADLP